MDLLYLIRSGLGVPDYWHPHLEIQTDFLSGQIGRYPFSMDIKADYPGRLSEDGVPVVFWGKDGSACASPVNIILFGLGSHDVFIRSKEERYRRQFISVLHWLRDHSVPFGNGISWIHEVDMPAYGLKAPWFSGIVQGFALSLFLRAHRLDSTGPWARLAYRTWLGYRLPIEKAGFCRDVDGGVVYEEYPGPRLDCVFNGMCHALIGLWEVWRSGLIPDAEVDFRNGVNGLRSLLARFDYRGWSLYSLSEPSGKPFLASPYYHRANGVLAQIMGLITKESDFHHYGEKWLKGSRSIVRRLTMSARIGLDRYLNAPSLLLYDKSKQPTGPVHGKCA